MFLCTERSPMLKHLSYEPMWHPDSCLSNLHLVSLVSLPHPTCSSNAIQDVESLVTSHLPATEMSAGYTRLPITQQ